MKFKQTLLLAFAGLALFGAQLTAQACTKPVALNNKAYIAAAKSAELPENCVHRIIYRGRIKRNQVQSGVWHPKTEKMQISDPIFHPQTDGLFISNLNM
jgi:hypothetical protein